jgi:HSP20 family protein
MAMRTIENIRDMAESMMEMTLGSATGIRVDVSETAEGVLVTAAIPGFEKEDLRVDVSGRTLTISAEKRTELERKHGRERAFQSVRRRITLPVEIKTDQAKAVWSDGVLKIDLRKTERAAGRRVQIQ